MICLGEIPFSPSLPSIFLLVKFSKNAFWAFWILGWLKGDIVSLLSGLSTFLCISILINLIIPLQEEETSYIHHLPFSGIDLSESSISLRFVLYFVWLKMSLRQWNAYCLKRGEWVEGKETHSVWLILGCQESHKFQTYNWASLYVEDSLAALLASFVSLSGTA